MVYLSVLLYRLQNFVVWLQTYLNVILKINRVFLCTCTCNFLQCVCVYKLKEQITNLDFILQTIYLGLDNKIFLNKICV